jgi:aminomethyltransferase
MVPFAGYDMPVQYPLGVMKEHLHTREKAGLFDVSHMGQVVIRGDNPAKALEALVPGDLQALEPGRIRYTMFTNDAAGILDDLMVTRVSDTELFVVINAGCKQADLAHMRAHLTGVEIEYLGDDAGLLALQGPMAAEVMARFVEEAATMPFMSMIATDIGGIPVRISRSGYTGEDGYEISVSAAMADALARLLLSEEEVEAIGLGARACHPVQLVERLPQVRHQQHPQRLVLMRLDLDDAVAVASRNALDFVDEHGFPDAP